MFGIHWAETYRSLHCAADHSFMDADIIVAIEQTGYFRSNIFHNQIIQVTQQILCYSTNLSEVYLNRANWNTLIRLNIIYNILVKTES